MRLSHKKKVYQKRMSMICGVRNWINSQFRPGPWFEGYYESAVELKSFPNAGYYLDRRPTRKLYRQGFFFGKKSVGAQA